ncbi:MAG TPA: galactokinase [Terriglobales bacterium]|nr:galactokinase [Terriglobales bacterium]
MITPTPSLAQRLDPWTELKIQFSNIFEAAPTLYRAPGRVNLIGEHTDYNDGFVMPAAIDLSCCIAIAPRDDRRLVVHSTNFNETSEFSLDERNVRAAHHWSDYVRGVAWVLENAAYKLRGANVAVMSNIPIGAGLSSSAAIEVATAYALLDISGLQVDRKQLAKLCQKAENEFVGARCGIMDQFIACHGQAGCALVLDCRSLNYRLLPLKGDVRLLICNTMVDHHIASGEYNVRRSECEQGVCQLATAIPGLKSLRDVTLAEIDSHRDKLTDVLYRRCRHVVTENQRVTEAAAALQRDDLNCFGRLMADSHRSLRDDYEVSCPELDLMVEIAARQEGVYGSRMTGGGFGGCTISLVKEDAISRLQQTIADAYEEKTGRRPEIYVCSPAEGVGAAR